MENNNQNILHPHDGFFKTAFSMQEVVEQYINDFLPENLVKNIDFKTLKEDKTDYITPALQSYFSDVVWQCNYGKHKVPVKVTFLFEHKSYIAKRPHLQLLRYMLEIWDHCERNNLDLTVVIPIIVYHNDKKQKWVKKPFPSYFKHIDETLNAYIPNFDYLLTDLTQYTSEQLLAMNMSLLLKTFMTLRFFKNEKMIFKHLKAMFVQLDGNGENAYLTKFFLAQFLYVSLNTEFDGPKAKKLLNELDKSNNMSTYEYLLNDTIQTLEARALERGMERGMEKGMERGMEKGMEKEKDNQKYLFTSNLILSTDFDDAKIALLAAVSISFVQELRAELNSTKN
jgi:predicted transposase YdaD